MSRAWLAVFVFSGCMESRVEQCGEWLCPDGTRCDPAHDLCVDPLRFTACESLADNVECSVRDVVVGYCNAGVCLDDGCGDGYKHGDELCDGNELGDRPNCKDHGFYDDKMAACNGACGYDTSGCTGFCGDGVENGDELCEVDPPLDHSCVEFGFDAGFLQCNNACGPRFDDCKQLGWRVEYPNSVGEIHGTSDTNIYAIQAIRTSTPSGLLHYDGSTWSTVDLSACRGGAELSALWVLGDKDVIVVGTAQTVLHVVGTTCTVLDTGSLGLARVWASSATDIYVAGGVTARHFDGTNWTVLPFSVRSNIWGSGRTDVYAGDTVLEHFDGTTWSPVAIAGLESVRTIAGTSATSVDVALMIGGRPALAHFDGSTWTRAPDPAELAGSIVDINGTKLIAEEQVHALLDGQWVNLRSPMTPSLQPNLWASPQGRLYAGGTSSMQSYAGGVWALDLGAGTVTLAAYTNTDAVAIGSNGLARWNGETWQVDTMAPTPSMQVVSFAPDGTLYAVGSPTSGSTLWKRQLDGTWINTLVPGGRYVHANSAGVWIGMINSVVDTDLRFWDGATITPYHFDDRVNRLWTIAPNDVYAVGQLGIYHFDGAAWTLAFAAEDLWRDDWASGPNDVYAIAGNGRLVHFDGASWQTIDLGTFTNLTAIAGFGPDDVFVAGEFGYLAHYDGVHWTPVRGPNISRLVARQSTLYAIDAGGAIYRLIRTIPW